MPCADIAIAIEITFWAIDIDNNDNHFTTLRALLNRVSVQLICTSDLTPRPIGSYDITSVSQLSSSAIIVFEIKEILVRIHYHVFAQFWKLGKLRKYPCWFTLWKIINRRASVNRNPALFEIIKALFSILIKSTVHHISHFEIKGYSWKCKGRVVWLSVKWNLMFASSNQIGGNP